ncbi:MAG: DUF3137 domain-containing protein [Pseudomonadota bacterium]
MTGTSGQMEPKSWEALERRDGFSGLRDIAERDTLPKLEDAAPRLANPSPINALYGGGCFVAFIGLLILVGLSSTFGVFGFVVGLVIAFFMAKPSIAKIAQFQIDRMIADLSFRQSVFAPLANHVELKYVAAPGGGQGIVAQQSKEGFFQDSFRRLHEALETYSGQDKSVVAARASGLVELATVIHIGGADEETKKARETGLTRLEDGFAGDHAGMHFDAFEVVRSPRRTDDGAVYEAEHALLIVLELPRPLQSTTQLRSKKIGWHKPGEADRLERVRLESNDFEDDFQVRSNDQVEARFVFTPDVMARVIDLAHGEQVRATAQGDHLVVALEGPNRFDLTSQDTGLDGDAAIRLAIQQIGEMLDLVETVADVFGIRD